jgi:DUF4097 and DUF4098 domain-containing protein YvlB
MSVTGAVLSVNTSCGLRCNASYEVHVPRGVRVSGQNDSGQVTLSDVSDVDIKLDSGDLAVRNATGSVSLSTDSGRVTATDVTGSATVSADSGDVELAGVGGSVKVTVGSGRIGASGLSGGPVTLATESGDVTVALRAPANLTARTDSGEIEVAAPDGCCRVQTDAGSGEEKVRISTNATSTFLLDLRTGSGDITVRPS